MTDKAKLTRQAICDRLAMEFQDSWIVNLGVGIPTLCSNYVDDSRTIFYQSENGVIGYGPLAAAGAEDRDLVNAGGQHVTIQPGMAVVHHADSFALIRGGFVDVTVLGAYQVAGNGDFANWRLPAFKGGGIGGAMDLAVGAKRVFLALEHTTRDGEPRLLERCRLPVTAVGVVKLVATDLGLFEVTANGFCLREHAPGWTPEEIQERTEARLSIADDLQPFRLRSVS